MVHACCAYGCRNLYVKGKGLGFFRFPPKIDRRILWTLAVRRKNFTPNSSTRICGDHFLSGRPSKDINNPDYVPSLFVYTDSKKLKREFKKSKGKNYKKELVSDVNDFSFLSSHKEDGLSSADVKEEILSDDEKEEEDNDSDSDSANFYKYPIEFTIPDFEVEVEHPTITKETVKTIVANDALNDPSSIPDKFAIYGKNRFPPKKYTFIDVSGKVLAKFTEKRLRINTPMERKRNRRHFSSHLVEQTVQVIVDRKNAKTAFVDVDAIRDYTKGLLNFKKKDEEYDSDYNENCNSELGEGEEEHLKENGYQNEILENGYQSDDMDSQMCSSSDATAQDGYKFISEIEINNDEKTDEDLFSWYSELKTLNNRKLAV